MSVPVEEAPVLEHNATEQRLADSINEAGAKSSHVGEVALALGGAFLLYRGFMKRRLKEEVQAHPPDPADPVEGLTRLVNLVAQAYMPTWVPTLAISLAAGYGEGLKETTAGRASQEWTELAAARYAASMGASINAVSTQALVEGVQAQINRGVPARMAIDRAIDAFGVAPRTMKTLVNIWTGTPQKATTARRTKPTIKDRIDATISSAITARAKTIGETESFLAKNVSKSLYWAYQARMGQIPADSMKRWVTAEDEFVCMVCGPMHGKEVLVTEKFTLPTKDVVMAPGTHPRCRCEVILVGKPISTYARRKDYALAKSAWGVVSKARGDDTYDRDASGQFASAESRGPKKSPRANIRVHENPDRPQVDYNDPRAQKLIQDAGSAFESPFESKFESKFQNKFESKFKSEKKSDDEAFQSRGSFQPSERFVEKSQQFMESASFQREEAVFAATAMFEEKYGDDEGVQEEEAYVYMSDYGGGMAGLYDMEGQSIDGEDEYEFDEMVLDYVNETAAFMFANMVNYHEGEEEDPFGDEQYADPNEEALGEYEGEEPTAAWLESHEHDAELNHGDEPLVRGEAYVRVSSGAYTLFLSQENFIELSQNIYMGADDSVDVRYGMSSGSRGFVSEDTGAYAEKTFTSSEIVDMLGEAGQELAEQAVMNRSVPIVVHGMNYDDDDFNIRQTPGLDAAFQAMMEDPWDSTPAVEPLLYDAYGS